MFLIELNGQTELFASRNMCSTPELAFSF